jgi:carboxyl-terminal processing protease
MLRFLKRIKVVFAAVVLLSIFSSYVFIDETEKQKVVLVAVLQNMLQYHYSAPEINDDFSSKVFESHLKDLDYNKRFFNQADYAFLKKFEKNLDDELESQQFNYFEAANSLFNKKIEFVNSFYKKILENPFDFTVDEKVELDAEKRAFAANDTALEELWRKYLKYQVLINIVGKLEIQEKAQETKDTTVKIKSFVVLEAEARAKVAKTHEDMFKRLSKVTKTDRFSEYINAIVHVFDPHSDFFPPKDKENFDIQLSGRLEGIGATLQEKEGYIKVMAIMPGSPSAKQGELKAEDLILKVGQGNEEPVDVVDMRLDNAVKLIRGKKGTWVKLTVKKPSGIIKVISILRDVVVMEESYAKSILVNDSKNSQKIGYINLPSFYVDFNNRGGRSCSEDIKKELLKLKAENVEGIVLDLRNNGGGSLQDVVTMGGFFIDEGPIVQVKSKEHEPYVLKDDYKGVVYDGPLVILINQFSASASEILAAAMQDYKRAVIIGSNTSFGKGTVQRIFELDLPSMYKELNPIGSAKITTQKFYRINGGSTQLKGVVPDVIVPDMYKYLDLGEKEMDYAMPWDQIPPAVYDEWVLKNGADLAKIKAKSAARVEKNEVFKMINASAEHLKHKQDNTVQTLSLVKYREELSNSKKEDDKFKDIDKEIADWDFKILKADETTVVDSTKIERNKSFIKTLKKDIYLHEAMGVIKDIRK